jgi:hypothetical protein
LEAAPFNEVDKGHFAADPVPTWCGLVADTRASRGVEIVDGATVCVAVVGSRTEAELLAGILRSHGLKAVCVGG